MATAWRTGLLGAALVACAGSTTQSAAVRTQQADSTATANSTSEVNPQASIDLAIAAARDLDLYDRPGGTLLAHLDEAFVLSSKTNGLVRVKGPTGVLEGYAAPAETNAKTRRGVGLFVAKPTPIEAEVDEFPLGTAYPGAFLPLLRFEGEMAVVALTPFGLAGRVSRAALTPQPVASASVPSYPLQVNNREIGIRVGKLRVVSQCTSPVAVIAERPDGIEVAQTVDGVQLVGRAEDAGTMCRPRVIDPQKDGLATKPIPSGWQTPAPFHTSLFAKSRDFYYATRDDYGKAECRKLSFQRHGHHTTLSSTFTGSPFAPLGLGAEGEAVTETTTYDIEGALPMIEKPTLLQLANSRSVRRKAKGGPVNDGVGEGDGGCSEPYYWLVGATADRVLVLADVSDASAYHPDDAITWYTQPEACEQAISAAKGTDKLAQFLLPVQSHGC